MTIGFGGKTCKKYLHYNHEIGMAFWKAQGDLPVQQQQPSRSLITFQKRKHGLETMPFLQQTILSKFMKLQTLKL